jgi:predicted dinucleotide-binding enzyme
MKIGVLGSGIVAQTLASGFLAHGHNVHIGTRDPDRLAQWSRQNPRGHVDSVTQTAAFGDIIVLAVKGLVASQVLRAAGAERLAAKTIIDATNPIADVQPTHGVLKFFTSLDESLMERLQREFAAAHFVKAFSSVGNLQFVNPHFQQGRPTMFICGDNAAAKQTVVQILDQFGWESADMGWVEAARAIEPLCMLWCIRGLLHNEWTHAFKLFRAK